MFMAMLTYSLISCCVSVSLVSDSLLSGALVCVLTGSLSVSLLTDSWPVCCQFHVQCAVMFIGQSVLQVNWSVCCQVNGLCCQVHGQCTTMYICQFANRFMASVLSFC